MIQAVGILGVLLLLLAFALNLSEKISERDARYLLMNFVGAGLAAVYAALTGSIPFVLLESVWSVAALVRFVQTMKKAPGGAGSL